MRVLIVAASALALPVACSSSCSGNEVARGGDAGNGAASGKPGGGGGDGGGVSSGGKEAGTGGDVPADVGPDAFGEGWELAPFNPPGCQILRATSLENTVPQLVWKDCGNGVPGCVFLDTSSLPGGSPPSDKLGGAFQVHHSGASTFFAISPRYGEYVDGVALYELGVGPRAAWKSDRLSDCVVQRLRFGIDGGAVLSFDSSKDSAVSNLLYTKDDPAKLDTAPMLVVDQSVTGKALLGVMDVQFSSALMALQMGLDSLIYTWDFGSGKPVLVPRPADVSEDYNAIVKGKEMAFERYSPTPTARAFAVRHPDGTVENLYQKPSVWASRLAGDDATLVWQEANETTGVLEVWTAPWTTSPSTFAPKKLRAVEHQQGVFVPAGYSGEQWWVYRKDDSTLRAVRLTDGAYLDALAPKGLGWLEPFGVVGGEVWCPIGTLPAGSTTYSIARVPIASLGVPKP